MRSTFCSSSRVARWWWALRTKTNKIAQPQSANVISTGPAGQRSSQPQPCPGSARLALLDSSHLETRLYRPRHSSFSLPFLSMPVERAPKSLKQCSLLNFAKPIRPSDITASNRSPTKLSHHDAEPGHVSELDETDTAVVDASPRPPNRVKLMPNPAPVPRPKAKAKAKAGHDDRSLEDAILCIKPEFTKLIAERKKNHEYRKYKLKDSVKHLWLYETAPTSAITYVHLLGLCDHYCICASIAPSLLPSPYSASTLLLSAFYFFPGLVLLALASSRV